MQDHINKEDKPTYHFHVWCPKCKAIEGIETEDERMARGLKESDYFFGPCPNCNEPFLRAVGASMPNN